MRPSLLITLALAAASTAFAQPARQPAIVWSGADVSMLPEVESVGGAFRASADALPEDAIPILRRAGVNLFRVRVFVNPSKDYAANWGATQDLASMRTLCKRIVAAGGHVLLDLHYSDTWADPEHQIKPAEWANLHGEALERQVHDYTRDVLRALAVDGVRPAIVQVGNEIAVGMLWPDGKLIDVPREREPEQWAIFARLLNAGCRAVREASADGGQPIRIAIHVHGGGDAQDVPIAFFRTLAQQRPAVDFDILALSFYPNWGGTLPTLKRQLATLAAEHPTKDLLIAETAYAWKPIPDLKPGLDLPWPLTPDGQRAFWLEINDTMRQTPRGIGCVWWYPEAIPQRGRSVFRDGAEAWFDDRGVALPILRNAAVAQ